MKNNKLLYLLTIFITLFTFNINANAAQGLTCVYKKGGLTDKIILIQDEDGAREIWANDKDASIDSAGWEKKYIPDLTRVSKAKIDSSNNLTSCPDFANAPQFEDKVDFLDEFKWWEVIINPNIWAPEELDKNSSLDYVRRPTSAQTDNPDNDNPTKGDTLIDIDDLDKSKYQASCTYRKIVENNKYHFVQLIYGKDSSGAMHIKFTEFDPSKGENGEFSGMKNGVQIIYPDYTTCKNPEFANLPICYTQQITYNFGVSPQFTANYFINTYSGECPQDGLFVSRIRGGKGIALGSTFNNVELNTTILTQEEAEIPANKAELYLFDSGVGNNPITGERIDADGVPNVDIQFEKINVENCTDLVGAEIAGYFKVIWNLVKIGIPILLIALGTIDFVQATFAGKEDEMKKAQTKFIKRIIIAAIIYLVPTLLGFLLKIANSVWPDIGTDICGIIF